MIPSSFIQDLLNRVDIVELVGRYVPLKKGGANFMGLCPFHNEKSPSFTVSPTKQFYHCFGCGAHGTAIGFLIEYSGLGFVEAVKELAQNAGMIVPENADKLSKLTPAQRIESQEKTLALSEVMTRASEFYRQQLRSAQRAKDYLIGRGLTGEIAARYAIGYAPEGWDSLRAVFPDYVSPVLVEAGLVIDKTENEKEKRYDRFRDRIIFPIRNAKGQAIGFGGRVIDNGEPKYLNSPETPLFQKGSELYGLFEARQAIRDAGYVLVTEGYMDVAALAQFGFAQVVATLGTACTSTHVQKLMRHTDRVIFSFDGDSAGRRAARRALEASLPYAQDNRVIAFLFLPDDHDPDSYIRAYGQQDFERQIQNATPLSQFLLQEAIQEIDLSTLEGRARVQFNAKPMLQALPPSALRLQIVRSLAKLTHTTPAEIEVACELTQLALRARAAPPSSKRAAPVGLGRQIMRLLVGHPSLLEMVDQAVLHAFNESAPESAALLTQLIALNQKIGMQLSFAALVECVQSMNTDLDGLIAEVASEAETDIDTARTELAGALRQLKMKACKTELERLAAAGLHSEEARCRYREIILQQEQIRRQAE